MGYVYNNVCISGILIWMSLTVSKIDYLFIRLIFFYKDRFSLKIGSLWKEWRKEGKRKGGRKGGRWKQDIGTNSSGTKSEFLILTFLIHFIYIISNTDYKSYFSLVFKSFLLLLFLI